MNKIKLIMFCMMFSCFLFVSQSSAIWSCLEGGLGAFVPGRVGINFSAKEIRRIDIVAGVSYNDDIDKVRKVLTSILENDSRVLKDPAPTIGVLELGDSSVNFAVRPWVKTSDYWNVYFATQESVKKEFYKAGISIPFPQQDVHLYKKDLTHITANEPQTSYTLQEDFQTNS